MLGICHIKEIVKTLYTKRINMKNTELIEKDNLHGKKAIKGNHIGFLQLWAFNNCYLFLDIETGKRFKIPIDKVDKIKLDIDEYQERYEKLIKSGVKLFDMKHLINNKTNKMWTWSFCRTLAMIKAKYDFYLEVMKRFGSWYDMPREEAYDLQSKYFISSDGNSVYQQMLDKIGMSDFSKCNLTKEEIIQVVRKANILDNEFHKVAYEHKLIILNPTTTKEEKIEARNCKQELKYYLNA